MIAVLAADRQAFHALRRQRRHDAAGGAVVRSDDSIDLVVIGGQDLLHVLLGILRQPAVGVLLADHFDIAALDRLIEHFELARMEKIGVGIGR